MPPLKNRKQTDARSDWVQRDILYVTAGLKEPHGLAVKDERDDYYDQEINHGRLYPNLVEKGLLEKGELDKRTNAYTVTQRGQHKIEVRREWENQYLESKESVPA